ncbi:MAG: hypothetical protein LBN30_07635 [Oscillospiraceae bacterium]|nr:hypothetical protein [Oscillospiraceae bacterium]
MKNTRKILALVLALVMAVSLSVSAFAVTTGTATISFTDNGAEIEGLTDLTITSGQTLREALDEVLTELNLVTAVEYDTFEDPIGVPQQALLGFTYDEYNDFYNNYIVEVDPNDPNHGHYEGTAWEYSYIEDNESVYGTQYITIFVVEDGDDITFDFHTDSFDW